MIYIDTSVMLAHLLAEDRAPQAWLWSEVLVTSRLAQYETWVVLHARRLAASHGEDLRQLLGRLSFLELDAAVLERALEPFAAPVRTLDALHLASLAYLREQGHAPKLATYDHRMAAAASSLKIDVVQP